MLVLVATNDTQGSDPGDYAHTVEGELVTPVVTQCSNPECGCDRGFPGLASSRATTTALVANRPGISLDDFRDVVLDWLERDGWIDLLAQTAQMQREQGVERDESHDSVKCLLDRHVDSIIGLCDYFGEGAIIGRNGREVFERASRRAA